MSQSQHTAHSKSLTTPAQQDRSGSVQALKDAGVRDNTKETYQKALRHYEHVYGATLPATPTMIEGYIDFCAREQGHTVKTIETRLAALSVFHRDQGYPNPVRTPGVNETLKGMRARHNQPVTKAPPLSLVELLQIVSSLEAQYNDDDAAHKPEQRRKQQRQALRDRAFFLVGFWFGYRSDELVRLKIEHCNIGHDHNSLSCYLPYSKGDRDALGETKTRSTLSATPYASLCPIVALQDWLDACGAKTGYVFTRINRWGTVADKPLHSDSIIKMMRTVLARAGLAGDSARFSGHSLKRGFAHWIVDQGGDVAALMSLVGWKDPKTAAGYVNDKPDTFDRLLSQTRSEPLPDARSLDLQAPSAALQNEKTPSDPSPPSRA